MIRKTAPAHSSMSLAIAALMCGAAILLLAVQPLSAQESETGEEKPVNAHTLLQRTLDDDLRTASETELREWCRRLGLEEVGNQAALKQRLLSYYAELFPSFSPQAVEPDQDVEPDRAGTGQTGGRDLTLQRADRLDLEGEQEQSFSLSGGVVVLMRDQAEDTVHTIEANALYYDSKAAILAAEGDVRYRMEQNGEVQEFTGDALSFDISDFHGIFLGGVTQQEQEMEGGTTTFYFRGRSIYRSPQKRIFFAGGRITSSRAEEPYYSITATHLWLLAPDEWALSGGVLRMGRVPVFYLPFFFQAGDELFFSPSFSYKDREGYAIQTTTYLLGRPEKQQSGGLSFLQMESDTAAYEYERRGLFLHKTGEAREDDWVSRSGSHVKFLLDYYTRLGLFLGFDVNLRDMPPMSGLELLAGAGFSRYLFPLPGYSGAYTPYLWDAGSSSYTTERQQPWLLGNRLPFRFGFGLSLDLNWQDGGLLLEAPLYSDPYFRSRLINRQETLGVEQFTAEEEFGTGMTQELLSDPVFRLSGEYNPRIDARSGTQLLSEFSIDRIETRLRLSQEDTLPQEEASGTESPIGFYYPEVLTPVDVIVRLGGTIFDIASQESRQSSAAKDSDEGDDSGETETPPGGLRPPEEEGVEESNSAAINAEGENNNEQNGTDPRLPSLRPHEEQSTRQVSSGLNQRLAYDVSSDFQYHRVYGDNAAAAPEDIGFSPTYSFVTTGGATDWSYRTDWAGNRVSLENSLGIDGELRRHYQEDPAVDISDFREQDRRASYAAIDNQLRVTGRLFPGGGAWSNSTLGYRIYSDLYELNYSSAADSFLPRYLRWDKEHIDVHETELVLRYSQGGNSLLASNTTELPPLNISTLFRLQARSKPADASVSMRLRETDEGKIAYGPLQAEGTARFFEHSRYTQKLYLLEEDADQRTIAELELAFFERQLRLLQSFEWNIDQVEPQRSYSSLDLWWLSFGYEARKAATYRLNPSKQWESTGEEDFVPYQLTAGIDYSYEPEPLWKRRIRLSAFADTMVRADLRRFTDSSLGFGAGLRGSIAEFLEFNFRVASENTAIYRYVPAWADKLEIPRVNPLKDLFRSFNFGNTEDRLLSNFNLNSLTLNLVHHMPDWDLRFDYSGVYEVNDAREKYEWNGSFTISLQWNPIPIIRRESRYDENGMEL